MKEKDFSKSIKLTFIILFGASLFWFLFACQLVWAYDPGGSPLDLKKNSRMNDTILIQPGTGTSGGSDTARFRTFYGTQACVGVGSNGYILSGTLTGLPFIDYLYGNGSSTINFSGFTTVAVGGSAIPSAGSVNGKIDAVAGTGTTNVFTDTTLAGQGTLTATLRANGVDISPTEVGYLDGVSGNVQTQITTATGSITNHTHTGSDGTIQIAHNSVTGTGANSHATIDNFIASKAAASGLASLDANSLVVQNPASGTSTPEASKIPISLGTGKIDDSWLSNNITKLGTPTTDVITEGSTNKYYTDARVNATIGSSSITSPQVSPKITFTSPAAGQFLKIVDSQGNVENGTSSASVGFDAVTGVPTDNANFKTEAGTSTVPIRDGSGNLFVSGIVGGTTTGALKIPAGTAAQRPASPEMGMLRYSTSVTAGTGGNISSYSGYTVHTFTSSGTFVPPTVANIEIYDGTIWRVVDTGTASIKYVSVFLVGGGGGGGLSGGGGGGGGGVLYMENYPCIGTVTVTVGAGGAASTNGNDSVFGNLTAIGGGAGGTAGTSHGKNGGSGGGGDNASTTPGSFMGSATASITGYGRNGGGGAGAGYNAAGGGGGGSLVGSNGTTTSGGMGGQGIISPIGSATAFAGGGGGYGSVVRGEGGFGGGGYGGSGAGGNAQAGTENTGGGGGGAGSAGGSGIVIIRYITP